MGKCHSNPSMGNQKLSEENGLFKALQDISGKAGRWSLSNPIVFLFGFLIMLDFTESTPLNNLCFSKIGARD